jgi:2-phospho-L-lactate/phosphoenolpyruvate guanylyltransferase
VKATRHKSRLWGILAPRDGAELARLFLGDLLETLRAAELIAHTYVVSPSPDLLREAERLGANAVKEEAEAGVNAAVLAGARAAGERDLLVLPTDLPLLTESDVRRTVSLRRSGLTVIAPSTEFNGTNVFAFGRGTLSRLSYDADSFWNHVAGAARARERLAVLTGGGVMEDVDTPADVERVIRSGINRASLRFLRKMVGQGRPSS